MIVVDGRRIEIPGVPSICWDDDPTVRMTKQSGAPRGRIWVRNVVLHTTRGIPVKLIKGKGHESGGAKNNARYWARHNGFSGAHLVVDYNGLVVCTADLVREKTWHATSVNDVSVGIEIVQGKDGEVYEGQLEDVVTLCDTLADESVLAIQRQFHAPYRRGRIVNRFATGAKDVVGFYGHRDQTNNKGPGDPGDFIFQFLERAGYEKFDYAAGEDLKAWKLRQAALGVEAAKCDGVAGPATVKLLKSAGYLGGQWTRGKKL